MAAAELIDQKDEVWRWLLFAKHAAQCAASIAEECEYGERCNAGKKLFKHIEGCKTQACPVPRCSFVKQAIDHYNSCQDACCALCTPVRKYSAKQQSSVRQRPQHSATSCPDVSWGQAPADCKSEAPEGSKALVLSPASFSVQRPMGGVFAARQGSSGHSPSQQARLGNGSSSPPQAPASLDMAARKGMEAPNSISMQSTQPYSPGLQVPALPAPRSSDAHSTGMSNHGLALVVTAEPGLEEVSNSSAHAVVPRGPCPEGSLSRHARVPPLQHPPPICRSISGLLSVSGAAGTGTGHPGASDTQPSPQLPQGAAMAAAPVHMEHLPGHAALPMSHAEAHGAGMLHPSAPVLQGIQPHQTGFAPWPASAGMHVQHGQMSLALPPGHAWHQQLSLAGPAGSMQLGPGTLMAPQQLHMPMGMQQLHMQVQQQNIMGWPGPVNVVANMPMAMSGGTGHAPGIFSPMQPFQGGPGAAMHSVMGPGAPVPVGMQAMIQGAQQVVIPSATGGPMQQPVVLAQMPSSNGFTSFHAHAGHAAPAGSVCMQMATVQQCSSSAFQPMVVHAPAPVAMQMQGMQQQQQQQPVPGMVQQPAAVQSIQPAGSIQQVASQSGQPAQPMPVSSASCPAANTISPPHQGLPPALQLSSPFALNSSRSLSPATAHANAAVSAPMLTHGSPAPDSSAASQDEPMDVQAAPVAAAIARPLPGTLAAELHDGMFDDIDHNWHTAKAHAPGIPVLMSS